MKRERTPKLDSERREFLVSMKPTLAELRLIDLRRDYAVYRSRFFGSTIPDLDSVVLGFCPGNVMRNIFSDDCLGFCIEGPVKYTAASVILIAWDTNDTVQVGTMVHEMAHLKINLRFNRNMGHGKYWQKEMKRLARLGAFKNIW